MDGVWYFYMEECPGVLLETVIGSMSSTELDHIADRLLDVLKEMRSYLGETLGTVTGGPYNDRFMPFPWNPPHAFKSTTEYLDHYRDFSLTSADLNTSRSCSATSRRIRPPHSW